MNRKQNKNSKAIIGSNKTAENAVKAVPKLGYLHVFIMSPKTTMDMLTAYLEKTAPSIAFSCKKLDKKDNSTASFMVSFPITEVSKVYDPAIWPDGSAVRRFVFF